MVRLFHSCCLLLIGWTLGCSSPVSDEKGQLNFGRDAGSTSSQSNVPKGGQPQSAGETEAGGFPMGGENSAGGQTGMDGGEEGSGGRPEVIPGDGPVGEGVGSPCNGAGDCPLGVLGIGLCLKEHYTNGYCSAACVQDMDCPEGSACVGRLCMKTCQANVDCRPSYACDQEFDEGPAVCVPTSEDLKDAAELCDVDDDCRGSILDRRCSVLGQDSNYCTGTCYLDGDCPKGNICSIGDGPEGYCIRACENSMQCPENFACYDYIELLTRRSGSTVRMSRAGCYPIAAGDGQTGDPCLGRGDCSGGRRGLCAYESDGGYCTQLCNADNGCPANAHCAFVNADNREGYCMKDCGIDGRCEPGQVCSNRDLGAEPLCVPGGVGESLPGEECQSVAECAGAEDAACLAPPGSERKICQRSCSFKNPCPNNHRCTRKNPLEVGVCAKICIPGEAGECPDGSACFDTDGDGLYECAPARYSTFEKALGEVCEGSGQCGRDLVCWAFDGGSLRGQCAQVCAANDECTDGAHCVGLTETNSTGLCQKNCSENGDCPTQTECIDLYDNDGTKECVITAIGSGRIGDPCDSRDDCGGGAFGWCIQSLNWTERGYCSQRGCTADAGCPEHSHCGYIDAQTGQGLCLSECDQNNRCDYGLNCVDSDGDGRQECVAQSSGSSPAGGGCKSARDCSTALCLTRGYPRGMCSGECTSNADCGAALHCEIFSANPRRGICSPDCQTDDDCRDGYRCREQYTRGVKTCVGLGYGQSAVGEPCRSSTDCAFGTDASCLSISGWSNGYCLGARCTPQDGCADGQHCAFYNPYSERGGYCVQSCDVDETCARDNYECRDYDEDGKTECAPRRQEIGGQGNCTDLNHCLSLCQNMFDASCNLACFEGASVAAVSRYEAMISCQMSAECAMGDHACRLSACTEERTECFGSPRLPSGQASCQAYEACGRQCDDNDSTCALQCLQDTSASAYNAYIEALDCNRYRGAASCETQIAACTR